MGLDLYVEGPVCSLEALLERLAAAGIAASVLMVDGQLRAPRAPAPAGWQDVRLKLPEGTVSLKRRGTGIAVVIFGNADEALRAAQHQVAERLSAP